VQRCGLHGLCAGSCPRQSAKAQRRLNLHQLRPTIASMA
jgi:hypothetical protein